MSTSTDASVADTADRLVNGERGDDYGHPYDDFARTAKGWEMILGVPVTPMQVALCMIQVKISRQCHRHKLDNLVDICGYALTGEKIMQREAEAPTTPKAPPKDMFGYGPPWCRCESPVHDANRACRRCGRSVADVTLTYDVPNQPVEEHDGDELVDWMNDHAAKAIKAMARKVNEMHSTLKTLTTPRPPIEQPAEAVSKLMDEDIPPCPGCGFRQQFVWPEGTVTCAHCAKVLSPQHFKASERCPSCTSLHRTKNGFGVVKCLICERLFP